MVNDRLKVGLLLDVVHMEGHKRRFDRLFNVWVLIDGFLDHAAELVLRNALVSDFGLETGITHFCDVISKTDNALKQALLGACNACNSCSSVTKYSHI